MHFDIRADGGSEFEVHCEDFRHGRTWLFNAILGVDHKRDEDVTVVVRMTAANMRGFQERIFKFRHQGRAEMFAAVYDVNKKQFLVDRPMDSELQKSVQSKDFSMFNIVQYGEDE